MIEVHLNVRKRMFSEIPSGGSVQPEAAARKLLGILSVDDPLDLGTDEPGGGVHIPKGRIAAPAVRGPTAAVFITAPVPLTAAAVVLTAVAAARASAAVVLIAGTTV